MDYKIDFPIALKVVSEDKQKAVYEIEGLYTGYGHTLGNSLRRAILSSLPGASVTSVKIEGVKHEFSSLPGIKEDVIEIMLNLKSLRFKMHTNEPQILTISEKGVKTVTAADIEAPSQIEVLNKETVIATLTDKKAEFKAEIVVEKGLGYVPREVLKKDKLEVGTMALDAVFTPIRKVQYGVENMRVGERTDYNRLRLAVETDGSLTPREAVENSLAILKEQFQALDDLFKGKTGKEEIEEAAEDLGEKEKEKEELAEDSLKIRVEDLNISGRTLNALSKAGIRTTGGLVRKKEEDLLKIDGLGKKSVQEIRRALGNLGLTLR